MELNIVLWTLASGILLLLLVVIKNVITKRRSNLPPGPPLWPIIGNLPQLGDRPHQSLFHLAQKYGPLMTLKLGNITTLVVSSPSMAREVLKNNDQIFSSRTINTAAKIFAYQGTSLVWSPYGPHWRLLRKIFNSEIFSAKRLDDLQHLRRDEVFRTLEAIYEDSKDGKIVNVGARAFMISLSLVGKMVCGKDVFHPGSKQAVEFKDMVWEVLKLTGVPNLSDLFPVLQRFDPQGLNRKMRRLAKKFDGMFDRLISERLAQRKENEKDFLQVLLDLREDGLEFTLEDIKGMLMDMFIAGTDTTSVTIEWTMAELLRKPTLMKKAQAEMDDVVGVERRMEESDIQNLPYLRAVMKEVFRLHPAAPLIVPRRADKACEIGGYTIPENTQVFVNVWGIGRHPNIWKEPLNFNPERFLKCDIDYRGQDFELLPFGAGRRICIGLPLAHRMVHLVVGSLLQAFNWSIPDDSGIDMSEVFGITLQKAEPLRAIPTPRLAKKFYS